MRVIALRVMAAILSGFVAFAPPAGGQELPPPLGGGPRDSAEVERFLNELMPGLLQEHQVAGAVVSVVSSEGVLFQRGYGYADWATRRAVDPEKSMFRIASVSKLFVWTAVMQLVERGLLDLNADINSYLDFEIPVAFGQPVTLSHLMAHTAGFDEVGVRVFDDPTLVRPLGEVLKEQLPARIRPPGDIAAYSNHGSAIAAYIVQRVSGTEWARYAEENIFEPLGMQYATFEQPIPGILAADIVTGHRWNGGRHVEVDVPYTDIPPIGSAVASASDMARFMVAHLQLGGVGDRRILGPQTTRLMHTDHHTMDPSLPGMAHGFQNLSRNGEWVIGHGGIMPMFSSLLMLLPERGIGVFASFNSRPRGPIKSRFEDAFFAHYFPHESAPVPIAYDIAAASRAAARFAGHYRRNVFPRSGVAKLEGLLRGNVISVSEEGTLEAHGSKWVQVAPFRFEDASGDGRALVFRADAAGRITHYFHSRAPIGAYERVPASEHPLLHLGLFAFAAAMIGLTLCTPIVLLVVRRRNGHRAPSGIPAAARWATWVAAAMLTTGLVAVTAIMGSTSYPLPSSLLGALWILAIAVIPVTFSVFLIIQLWLKREGPVGSRIFHTVATLGFCTLVWQLTIWNVVPWKF